MEEKEEEDNIKVLTKRHITWVVGATDVNYPVIILMMIRDKAAMAAAAGIVIVHA